MSTSGTPQRVTFTFRRIEAGSVFSSQEDCHCLFLNNLVREIVHLMATAHLRLEPNLPKPGNGSEDGEVLSGNDDSHSQSPVDKTRSVHSRETPRRKARRRSKYDILEEGWNKKFTDLTSKVDLLLNPTLSLPTPAPQRPLTVESVYSDASSDDDASKQDDVLSLSASGRFSDSDNDSVQIDENNKETNKNLSASTRKCLYDIFGEDAGVKKTVKKVGIVIDQSQKDVLETSYRTSEPNFLTAFSEDNFDLFPINEDTEKYLEVPSLDSLVDSCLVKRLGPKASFSKSKNKTLFTQPSKMIEKIAYKGQQAARFGIVMQLYIQQSLGNLVEHFQPDNFDKEEGLEQVKNVFSMTTKCLDQIGCAGAFHHIIRRTAAMSDTALYELDDRLEFSNLPLTGEGFFGSGLENLLKSRKEKKKQIEDLVPEVKKKVFKRKSESPSRTDDNKRPHYDKRPVQGSSFLNSKPKDWDSFHIPKTPHEQRYQGHQGFQGHRQESRRQSRGAGSSRPYSNRGHGYGRSTAK